MIDVTERDLELARGLLAPTRRAPRASGVTWDAREIVGARYGPIAVWSKGSGPVALLVHGWETDHVDMDAFVDPLVAAGRRVVAFDLPAHGETPGEHAHLLDLACAVEDVAAHVAGADVVVAHSVGCAATAIALAGGLRLRRVAFIAPPLRYEAFARFYAAQNGVEGDVLVAALARLGLDVSPLDIRKNAADVDVPLTIVHSTDDRVCDATNATKIAAVWKNSAVTFVEGLGHARILRDRAVVALVLDAVR